jgi:carbonic anhydrase
MKTIDIIYRYESLDRPARTRPSDSKSALLRLNEDNRAFAALLDGSGTDGERVQWIVSIDPRDLGMLRGAMASPPQQPFAAVLGCSDARVPIELIFNEGPNDLFVVRVAGNSLGAEVLGSLKYAVDHLSGSLKVIVVLGHSHCGAVTGAVDVFLNPASYLPFATKHSLRNILDGLLVVVQASARKIEEALGPEITRHPGYREALIEASIAANAALTAYSLQQEFGAADQTGLQAVYGVYQLESRRVWSPHAGDERGLGLAPAPRDRAEFAALGDAILRSDRIASLLCP